MGALERVEREREINVKDNEHHITYSEALYGGGGGAGMDDIPFEWPFVVPFECLVIPLVPFVCSRR